MFMNKTNKPTIPKKEAKDNKDAVLCDSCDRYFYRHFIHKRKGGNYCYSCEELSIRSQSIKGQLNDEEVQKMLKRLLNTPPRKKDKEKK